MHRSRLFGILVDAPLDQAGQAADFWSQALGATPIPEDDEYTALKGASTVAVVVQAVDDAPRYHLDIETDDIGAETDRLIGLGATVHERKESWVILRAPGGHLVCVVAVQSPKAEFAAGAKTWGSETAGDTGDGSGGPARDKMRRDRVASPVRTKGTSVELLHSGKVRDVYADGADVILVASDRISVYDVVLPTPIPDKGQVLTRLSLWWFEQLEDVIGNHVISATDVPAEWRGRAIRCRRLDMVQVECIARGYLTGLGLSEYRRSGAVSGVPLEPGLVEADRLPQPIFTPTTKGPLGQHDEFITFADVVAREGPQTAEELRRITLDVYRRGAELAAEQGIIIADTKIEIGRTPDGTLLLADEVLTPDSSRFWPAADYQPGRTQFSYDKQMVRDWAAGTGWDKTPPGPEIPEEVVAGTRARYIEVYERITGDTW